MKKLVLILTLTALLVSCGSKKEVAPRTETWSAGCAYFSALHGGYAISGLCCQRIEMPFFVMKNGTSFSAKGQYESTKAGETSKMPITITGDLSADGTTLNVNYTGVGLQNTIQMKAGKPVMACLCGCG